VTDSIWT